MSRIYIIEPTEDVAPQTQGEENAPQETRKQQRKHDRYIIDGYHYIRHWTNVDGSLRIRCRKKKCKGRGTYKPDGTFVQKNDEKHNKCKADTYAIEKQQFREELIAEVRISNENGRRIFDRLRKEWPSAIALNYNDYRDTIKREKKKVNPPMPRNLEDMAKYLSSTEWRKILQYDYDHSGQMTAKLVENNNPTDKSTSHSLVFADRAFILHVLQESENESLEAFQDATFKAVPKAVGAKQLLLFQVSRFNHAVVLAYALMERKTTEAYQAVLEYLFCELAPELKNKVKKIHLDFEIAESNALERIVPDIGLVPCLFHYDQAQWKNAQKNGALKKPPKIRNNTVEENEQIQKEKEILAEVKKILGLFRKFPYLPYTMIDDGLADYIIGKMTPEGQERISGYVAYWKRQWLHRCSPQKWSIHGEPFRTNNFCESRNRDINSLFKKNPSPWQFVRTLGELQNIVARDFDVHRKPRTYDRQKEKNIEYCMTDVAARRISRMDCLLSLIGLDDDMNDRAFEQLLDDLEEELECEDLEGDEGKQNPNYSMSIESISGNSRPSLGTEFISMENNESLNQGLRTPLSIIKSQSNSSGSVSASKRKYTVIQSVEEDCQFFHFSSSEAILQQSNEEQPLVSNPLKKKSRPNILRKR